MRDACFCTFELDNVLSVSTSAEGYRRRTCPWYNLQCNLSTSSSRTNPERMYYWCPNCTFFQWYDELIEGMNYNIKLRRCDIHQNNQPQGSQENIMVKPELMVIQQQIVDTLGSIQQFIFFLCIANAIMFVLLLLKSF
ncbi:hypothetical protein AMTRI_Chr01g127890 [Amborella trichopoda]